MKKLFSLSLCLLMMGATLSLATSTTQAQTQTSATQKEDFSVFIKKFAKDYAFQLTRITFPFGGSVYIDEAGNEEKTPYTKESWNKNRFDEWLLGVAKLTTEKDGSKKYEWITDGGACGGTAKFSLKDGKWRLVDYTSWCI